MVRARERSLGRDPQLRPVVELVDGQLLLAGGDALKQFVAGTAKSAPPDAELIRRAIAFDAASRPREVDGAMLVRAGRARLCPPIDPALWR